MEQVIGRNRRLRWTLAVLLGTAVACLPLLRANAAPTTSRIQGNDRYETSAAISASQFTSPPVPVAYVATGADFPDALAASPVAAKGGGPVLLVQTGSIPTAVANELTRLKPTKIVVVGGTSAVTTGVQTTLGSYSSNVTRVSGNDRYETAADLSAATFAVNTNTVYVATGQNFPDALAGGPAAANAPGGGGPVLLVQTNSIPTATANELTRLKPTNIVVLGGTSAVTDAVKTQLGSYASTVVRRFGADRYLTSVDISSHTFTSATRVYLATGLDFPDALSGGAVAGINKAPVLLVHQDCMTAEVNAEITRLSPGQLIALGGPSAVSDAVLNRTVCPASTTTTSPFGSIPTTPTSFCLPGPTTIPSIPTC
jgi:putative cell wall-binding protein